MVYSQHNRTISATESHEKLGIIISSPFFKFKLSNDNKIASVPEPTVATNLLPVNFLIFFLNFLQIVRK